ncbi:LysR substrate-binding domain-containing protein [Vibrio japonicus]|uniref:LysR substrate-binding domain-containing protein n=1 Tax=Vibrio japonicus TaxID=1824638 RepID=A0ABY5LJ40_9VIBR|nr:LysR substrate-binding domain-containing protein [Vibrio japonicus]UUM32057.1 LysR substrate-binding domain-containing protein [Vibrio japonicus]
MNSRLPSTKNLQAFLATAEHLNFTHAAEKLNMTQGAISRQIQALESIIGATLFYRQARGLSLTPEGDKFVPKAEDIIKRLQIAVREVSEGANRIKLNAPSCVTSWILARIASFQQAYPEINVELTSTTKHQAIPNFDSFDLVVMYGKPAKSKSIRQALLFEEKLAPICSPELWAKQTSRSNRTDQRLLDLFTWLHANQEQSDWKLWLNECGLADLRGKTNQTFATLDQAMNAAQLGYGIAIGDLTLAEQDLKLKRVIQPFDEVVSSGNGYYLMSHSDNDNATISNLVDWLTSTEHQSKFV